MLSGLFETLFWVDNLTKILVGVVTFIGIVVYLFARNYMQGERGYRKFMLLLASLVFCVITLMISNNLYLTLTMWGLTNLITIRLMIHKANWKAAANSGRLAALTFLVGAGSLSTAFIIMHIQTGMVSIQDILAYQHSSSVMMFISSVLILIAAISQSAIWPFNKWLLSSLNSPTPVSAIMHAGVVNGGGILLIKFSPLLISFPILLKSIFILGLISACLGSLWKLMQHDVKRMLACSTMGQMGFMLAQCGMGLFSSAIVHICCHGLFKANLFLGSNNMGKEKKINKTNNLDMSSVLLALVSGLVASYLYAKGLSTEWFVADTRMIQIGLVLVLAMQVSISINEGEKLWKKLINLVFMGLIAYCYGYSNYVIEILLNSKQLFEPQPLDAIYILGFAIFLTVWILMLFVHKWNAADRLPALFLKLYVKNLNYSQPHTSTVTTHRNLYQN